MILRIVLCSATLMCTYAMVQLEMRYYNMPIDILLNMVTHFLGGLATGLGILIGKDMINVLIPNTIPEFPLWAMIFIVLVVGLVWEVFEIVYKSNIFFTLDTGKDICMDAGGAVLAYWLGRITTKN
ncbi:MAG: hypothetical protein WAX38_03655 [Minisyncoccia bacterium]